jgi:hypothetical protein
MKLLFASMILAALANSALGQSQIEVPKCSLTLAQSPTIRGLRLGMDVEEVLRHFPDRSVDPTVRRVLLDADKQFGVAKFLASTYPYQSEPRFAGISQFFFEFLDKRLSSFSVQYEGPEWNNVDEFISKLAEFLNLPSANNWKPSNIETVKTLNCAGFEVRVSLGSQGSTSLQVRNPTAEQIVKDRQKEVKERARKEFKP